MRPFIVRLAFVSVAFLALWLMLIILEVRGFPQDTLNGIYLVSLLAALIGFAWSWNISPWVTSSNGVAQLLKQIGGTLGTTTIASLINLIVAVNFKLLIGGTL